jgi:hypothetical protein
LIFYPDTTSGGSYRQNSTPEFVVMPDSGSEAAEINMAAHKISSVLHE